MSAESAREKIDNFQRLSPDVIPVWNISRVKRDSVFLFDNNSNGGKRKEYRFGTREFVILNIMACTPVLTAREISEYMGIAYFTARNYIHDIYRKFDDDGSLSLSKETFPNRLMELGVLSFENRVPF